MNLLSNTGGRSTISSESLIAGEAGLMLLLKPVYRKGVDGSITVCDAAEGEGDLLFKRVRRRLKRLSLLWLWLPLDVLARESREGLEREAGPAVAAAIVVYQSPTLACV